MSTDPWLERRARLHAALDGLDFLLGEWRLEGESDGAPVRGQCVVRRILDRSWVEARERLDGPDGDPEHADICLYTWDDAARALVVQHAMPDGLLERHQVLPLEGRPGFHWVPTGLGAPVLRLIPEPEGWRMELSRPPEVEPSTVVRYRKA